MEAGPFNDVILAYRNGAPIRVRDVGQAVADQVDRTVAAYQNNKDGIILAVFKQPGANVVDTVDQIKAQIPQLTARIPPAIEVRTLLDRTPRSAPPSPTSNSPWDSPSRWWSW